MKNLFATLALAALPLTAQPVTYVIDSAHSSAQFSIRHMMVSNTKGEFTKVEGTIVYDAKNPAASKVDAVIDVNTINTRDAKRDGHLRSPDFFDVAKFPKMTFTSKQVTKQGSKLLVKGDLTMHGVTKPVTLTVEGPSAEVKDPWGGAKIGASATTTVKRTDFGIVYNKTLEAGGVLIGDDVAITLDIEAERKK